MSIIASSPVKSRSLLNADNQSLKDGRRGGESEPLPRSLAAAQRPALCTWKEGNELHRGKKKKKESDEFRRWREERNINPWMKIRPRADKHREIRSGVKGKKKRVAVIRDYYHLFDSRDVATMFMNTVEYYSNVGLVFRNKESGEYKRMAICSRWNTKKDEWYRKRYWDIYESVKDETKVTMLAIGYDQRNMYRIMEMSDWKGDFHGYLMSRIGDDIRAFLKRLRSFLKRHGKGWAYRGYAIEPHKASGLPHIHFYFKGGWIADIDDIVRLWGLSQPQGVKVTVRTGSKVAGYLSSYLKKAINCIRGNEVHLFYAYAYFFGVPLYRVAYGKRKHVEEECECVEISEDEIPIEKKFVKGKWECVGTDIINNDNEWDRRFKPFKMDDRMSVDQFEKIYKEPDEDFPREEIWWHDYPKILSEVKDEEKEKGKAE